MRLEPQILRAASRRRLLAASTTLLQACGGGDDEPQRNIVELAQNTPELSILVEAVVAAGIAMGAIIAMTAVIAPAATIKMLRGRRGAHRSSR